MKKNLLFRFLAVAMVIVMLATSFVSTSALALSAPGNGDENDDLYSIVFEDGVLTVKVNPDRVYDMLKDKTLTKEELLEFLPADILETASKGKDLTKDDIVELISSYITVDGLKAMVNDLPVDVVKKYFSYEMITEIVSVAEIIDLLKVEEMMAQIDGEDIEALLTDEVRELAFNKAVVDMLLANGIVDDLIGSTTIIDDVLADENMKAQIYALVDDDLVNTIMQNEDNKAALEALASTDAVIGRILGKPEYLAILGDFITKAEYSAELELLLSDPVVEAFVSASEELKSYLTEEETIIALIDAGVVDTADLRTILGDANIAAIITEDVIADQIADPNAGLLDYVLETPAFRDAIVTPENYLEMVDKGWVSAGISDPDDIAAAMKTAITTIPAARDFIVAKVANVSETLSMNDKVACLDAFNLETFAASTKGDIRNILATDADAYTRLNNTVAIADVMAVVGKDFVKNNAADVVKGVGADVIFTYYSYDAAVAALGGYTTIVNDGIITTDEVAECVGGYAVLFGYFDVDDIIAIVGMDTILSYVDFNKVIEDIGGFENLLALYTQEELTAIVNAIGNDGINSFIQNSGMLDVIDVKEMAKDFIDYAKSKAPAIKALIKTVARQSLTILLTEVDGIYINEEIVYELGQFDLNKIIIEILRVLPDVGTFLELEEGDNFAEFVVSVDMGENVYEYGVEFGFIGDPSNLQKLLAGFEDTFEYDVTDEGLVDVSIVAPSVVADIYEKVLESENVPETLKAKLLDAPTTSLEDLGNMIAEISEEEIAYIASVAKEKANEIKAKAYTFVEEKILANYDAIMAKADAAADKVGEKLDAAGVGFLGDKVEYYLDKAGNKVTKEAVEAKVDAAKNAVDNAIEVATDPAKLTALKNKVVAGFDKIPAKLSNLTVADLYMGEGLFTVALGGSVDIFEAINRVVELPEEAKILFKSTVISLGAELDLKLEGLYKLELVLADGSVFTTYLPEGTAFETLDALGYYASGIIDEDLNPVTEMPAEDVKLYSNDLYTVQFVVDGEVIETIFYPYGTESIDEPEIPEYAEKEGFTAAWEEYELNVVKRLTVTVEYTEIENPDDPDDPDDPEEKKYKATFMADGEVVKVIEFTDETTEEAFKKLVPKVPAKTGYTAAWEDYEFKYEDFTVNAVYTAKTYKAYFYAGSTLVATVEFTIEDKTINEPAVPAKTGYTGEWSDYTILPRDIRINAIYTAIEYTATFVADGKVVGEPVKFTVADTSIPEPEVPAKTGYTGKWEAYTLEARDITINAEYTAIKYNATFVADGNVVAVVPFTVNDTKINEPAVPEKLGFTGAWESYTLEARDITINATYKHNIYTATFMADGNVVSVVQFTIEDKTIQEPKVPAKEGYTGVWEEYELKAENITINAIYTPVEAESGFWWWWILLIVAVIVIAVVVFFIVKSKKDGGTPTPPPAVDPEPVVEPTPDPEPIPVVVPETVDDIEPEMADTLMTDDDALASVIVKECSEAQGPKAVVNLSKINAAFADGETVSLETLKAKNLVSSKTARVKILADGHLNKHNLTVEANSFSVQAIKMIKLTGGNVIQDK